MNIIVLIVYMAIKTLDGVLVSNQRQWQKKTKRWKKRWIGKMKWNEVKWIEMDWLEMDS